MKQRARKVIITTLSILVIGFLYGCFCMATGIAIPCLFHKVTGLLCPGCGVSRMFLSLMRGDIAKAAKYNGLLLFLLPFLLLIFGDYLIRYVKTGKYILRKWENAVLYVMIVLLIVFGILRNLHTLN